jgi:hypothetical protein
MMSTWLIRTSDNLILGPVSKERVIELVSTDSLLPEDELCSGDGFWFFIREEELYNAYLLEGIEQGPNPIQEALESDEEVSLPKIERRNEKKKKKTVIIEKQASGENLQEVDVDDDVDVIAVPAREDLEFPDIETIKTEVGKEAPAIKSTKKHKKEEKVPINEVHEASDDSEEKLIPDDSDLEFPEVKIKKRSAAPPVEKVKVGTRERSKAKTKEKEASAKEKPTKEKPTKNKEQGPSDRYLFMVVAIIFIILGVIAFYYLKVINRALVGEWIKDIPSLIIEETYADGKPEGLVKKKLS